MSTSQWQDQQWPAELTPYLLRMRIIVFALVAGCVFFLVPCLVISGGQPKAANPPVISYTALVFAITAVFARMIVPGIVVGVGRKQITRETALESEDFELPTDVADLFKSPEFGNKLCMLLQTSTIVSCALLEGAAFFATIAYLIEGTLLSIIVAVALIFGLMLHFPTRSRVVDWIQRQLTELNAFESNVQDEY